jgi:hypothetical protein
MQEIIGLFSPTLCCYPTELEKNSPPESNAKIIRQIGIFTSTPSYIFIP